MPFLHLFQPLLLFRRKKGRNLPMRFRDRFVDASPGGPSNLFQLGGRFIDDR